MMMILQIMMMIQNSFTTALDTKPLNFNLNLKTMDGNTWDGENQAKRSRSSPLAPPPPNQPD